ncbi:MAG: glycosyltransferase family protein, partial [Patescibacteria group bacterium]
RYGSDRLNWYRDLFLTFANVERCFKGVPDVVLSDYEPNSAQYAYARGLPLFCLEQQSKFLGYTFPDIGAFSAEEEISRLRYFFPAAVKRYASSFFPLPKKCGEWNVEPIPPIVGTASGTRIRTDKVLVYLSPYGKGDARYASVIRILNGFPEYRFYVYSSVDFPVSMRRPNVILNRISNGFQNDIRDCGCIISTAGHQLISEAIQMEKPVLLLPLNTFEQHTNARMAVAYRLGATFRPTTRDTLRSFMTHLETYRSNIRRFKRIHWKRTWRGVLMKKLHEQADL